MRRRDFITFLGGVAAWPMVARAQQPNMPVIGILSLDRAQSKSASEKYTAFLLGLREMGFVVDRNTAIEYRFAEGEPQKVPALAADLIKRRVNLIVADANLAADAKRATQTIPIVFYQGGDPVRAGVVASLNRPGGNLTGFTRLGAEIASKRLALLHDLVPNASLIGALSDSDVVQGSVQDDEISVAAHDLGLTIKQIKLSALSDGQAEWDNAFAGLPRERVSALFVAASIRFSINAPERLVQLAARYRIPTVYDGPEFARRGGLMSYGASIQDIFRQMGLYAGRILKGEKPADLPVQTPTKYELVLNLKTAKTLDLTVPASLLAIADEVIE
jgi:putative ABC transport system substrate-binding protein